MAKLTEAQKKARKAKTAKHVAGLFKSGALVQVGKCVSKANSVGKNVHIRTECTLKRRVKANK